jgi:acyl carrier protein
MLLCTEFLTDLRVGEILDIVAKETDVQREALVAGITLDELGIPSLDLTHALFAIEAHFDIEIPMVSKDQQGAEFTTIDALVAHILATLDRPAAASPAAAPGAT